MCEYLKLEVEQLKRSLKNQEMELFTLVNTIYNNELDNQIRDEQICKLESSCADLNTRINQLLQLHEYQTLCEHEFTEDLIDINPERSKVIYFCRLCLFSKDT